MLCKLNCYPTLVSTSIKVVFSANPQDFEVLLQEETQTTPKIKIAIYKIFFMMLF